MGWLRFCSVFYFLSSCASTSSFDQSFSRLSFALTDWKGFRRQVIPFMYVHANGKIDLADKNDTFYRFSLGRGLVQAVEIIIFSVWTSVRWRRRMWFLANRNYGIVAVAPIQLRKTNEFAIKKNIFRFLFFPSMTRRFRIFLCSCLRCSHASGPRILLNVLHINSGRWYDAANYESINKNKCHCFVPVAHFSIIGSSSMWWRWRWWLVMVWHGRNDNSAHKSIVFGLSGITTL